MGFRVRVFEPSPEMPAAAATPAQAQAELDTVDRYLRALHSGQPGWTTAEFAALEFAFVQVARSFSARLGICYAAWRDVDVTAATLASAGIRESATSVISPVYAQPRLAAAPAPTHLRRATRRSRFRDSRQTSWRSSRRQLPRS